MNKSMINWLDKAVQNGDGCVKHSWPQARFILDHNQWNMNTNNTNANSSISNEYDENNFEYQIEPRLHFIGHLNELEDLLKIFKDSKERTTNINNNKSSWSFISANRNATLNEMKEKYFNWRQAKKYISNSTLQRICKYVAIDYYVFDFLDLGSNSINKDNDDNYIQSCRYNGYG